MKKTRAPRNAPPSVLIVDDEAVLAKSTAGWLERKGFHTQICHTGEAALAACAGRKFDAIITDLELPDLHGSELVKRLGKRNPAPRLVVLSAHPPPSLLPSSCVYLQKPFDLESLLQLLQGS